MSVQDTPLAAFLRWVANETGASVVASESLDARSLTLEVQDVAVSDLLGIVARRLGVQVSRTGELFFIGELRPEDRGVLVRRVRRLESKELRISLAILQSEYGRSDVYDDGLVVVGDRVEVLQRVNEMLDRIEAAPADSWVLQLSIVSLSDKDVARLGVDIEPFGELAATYANGASILQSSVKLAAGLKAVLRVASTSDRSRIIAQPMMYLGDGRTAKITDGRRVPVARRTVSPEGVVTVTGFDQIQTGLDVDATLRESSNDEARVSLKLSISEIVGLVENEAPITQAVTFDTVATIRSAGVYLMGSVERHQDRKGLSGGLSTTREDGSEHSVVQVWVRAYRVKGLSPGQLPGVALGEGSKGDTLGNAKVSPLVGRGGVADPPVRRETAETAGKVDNRLAVPR